MTSLSAYGTQFKRFLSGRVALLFSLILLLLVLAAAFCHQLAPQNPYDLKSIDFFDGQLPPLSTGSNGTIFYWLGTDAQGRDILSAILFGLRTSIIIGLSATFAAMVIGTTLGLLAGYRGGWLGTVLMRVVDFQLSFPAILSALMIISILGKGTFNVLLALVLVEWAYYARATRAAAMVEANKDYVHAARGLKLSSMRILLRHILPNCASPIIVLSTIQAARAISLEATLSFIGLGVPITQPSLGLLIANGFDFIISGMYWMSFFPGIALVILVASLNVIGDRVQFFLNPRRSV